MRMTNLAFRGWIRTRTRTRTSCRPRQCGTRASGRMARSMLRHRSSFLLVPPSTSVRGRDERQANPIYMHPTSPRLRFSTSDQSQSQTAELGIGDACRSRSLRPHAAGRMPMPAESGGTSRYHNATSVSICPCSRRLDVRFMTRWQWQEGTAHSGAQNPVLGQFNTTLDLILLFVLDSGSVGREWCPHGSPLKLEYIYLEIGSPDQHITLPSDTRGQGRGEGRGPKAEERGRSLLLTADSVPCRPGEESSAIRVEKVLYDVLKSKTTLMVASRIPDCLTHVR
jgi:hypothetical protein